MKKQKQKQEQKQKQLLACFRSINGIATRIKCDSIDREVMEHDRSLAASMTQGKIVAYVGTKIVASWPAMDTYWIRPA